MTTVPNRPNTALIVIDVQHGVVEGSHERDAVVANISGLVDRARRDDVPVVWVQHSDDGLVRGSEEWQIVSELTPRADRIVDREAIRRRVRGHAARDRAV